jgi:hypothetical protein
MAYTLITMLVSLLMDLLTVSRKSEADKDLEILVLRHQLRLLQRKLESIPRLTRVEKVFLAVLGVRFKASVQGARVRLEQSLLLFRPETIFKWHREVVARKWTFAHKPKVGRPRRAAELESL